MLSPKLSFSQFFNSTWLKIPQVWRDADKDNGKPLQLMVLTICQHMYYYFYEKIVNMDEIFDVDKCPKEYLKFLASVVGWELIGQDSDSWRNQIRSCPLLYKLRGNKRGLMLAEKLVGYSVFMSELYRDYTGNLQTKEHIFSSFPISLRMKPWFRKRPMPDISEFINSTVDSDAFQSYNTSSGAILTKTGDIYYPKFLKRISNRRQLSTINPYDIITGVRSKARLAKTTRYNFVLKKDTDLDFINPFTGKMTEVNIEGAIRLLMEFKPFHIYIQDLVIMVSLSDYLSLINKPIDTEYLLFTDYDDTSIGIFDTEKEKFFKQSEFAGVCSVSNTKEEFFNKGIMELKHVTLKTTKKSLVSSINTLFNIGLPLSGAIRKTLVGEADQIWYYFNPPTDTTDPRWAYVDPNNQFVWVRDSNPYNDTYGKDIWYDSNTGNTVRAVDLGDSVKFGFYSLPIIRDFEIVDLKQFFSTRKQTSNFTSNEVLSISHSSSDYYSGKVVLKVDGDNFKTLTQTAIFNN